MAIYTSILTGGSNNHETTSEAANGAQTDLIGEGIVGVITNTGGVAPATGAFAVNAQGTPAMAVDVSAGLAYVTATPTGQNSQNLRIRNTATASVSISANSTGSTKYDWIYLAVDATKAANPAVDGDDVASIVVSRSTSSSSDDGTPPTYATLLAKVTVANGATSITNGNIADARSNITVPVASVDTAQLKDDAVTPEKRSGGFKIGIITGATFGSTGNKAITGVGFRPKLIKFSMMPSNSSGNVLLGFGAATANEQYVVAGTASLSATRRHSSTSDCVAYMGTAETPVLLASRVSLDEDGFTLNVSIASSSFDVAYEAYA